jgi:hypothetical protein
MDGQHSRVDVIPTDGTPHKDGLPQGNPTPQVEEEIYVPEKVKQTEM